MKTPRMTGKEIILRYLKTHARFSAPELVEKLGVKRTVINQAAGKMVREGLLVVDGYTDKITHYRKPTKGAAGAETTGRMATGAVSN